MPDMSHLKPGDPVAILSGSYAARSRHVKRATVKRVTKTQFTLNESDHSYRLSDGRRRGHTNQWEPTPIAYPTDHPEVLEAVYEIKKWNLKTQLWDTSRHLVNAVLNARSVTLEDLDRFQELITKAQGGLDALRTHLSARSTQTDGPDEAGAGS